MLFYLNKIKNYKVNICFNNVWNGLEMRKKKQGNFEDNVLCSCPRGNMYIEETQCNYIEMMAQEGGEQGSKPNWENNNNFKTTVGF